MIGTGWEIFSPPSGEPVTVTPVGISGTPSGVICDDRPALRRTVTSLLLRCGFEVSGEVRHYDELREAVLRAAPTVAIVSLPAPGLSGLTAVAALRAAAPTTELILLSAFGSLEAAALEAGALALVSEDDPQVLQAVLLALSQRWHACMAATAAQQGYEGADLDRTFPFSAA